MKTRGLLTVKQAKTIVRNPMAALSKREQEVFMLLAKGYTSTETSEKLKIHAKTVHEYVRRLVEKLDLTCKADFTCLALKLKLIDGTLGVRLTDDHPQEVVYPSQTLSETLG